MENYSEIIPNLYIGNRNASLELFPVLSLIVNCTRDLPIFKNSIRIPIDDSPDWNFDFNNLMIETNVLEHIHNCLINQQKVLVHCMAGAQRSCAVVACYLIRYYSFTPEKAIQFIKKRRPIAFFGHVTFIEAINYFYYS
jgi:protein-tyrosine phosphatase